MVLPSPPPYTDPIPNNPFYSPQQYAVSAVPGLFVVGSGLSVSPLGVLTSTGGGGGGITADAFTGKGVLLTGTAPGAYAALPVGTDTQFLMASSCAPGGVCWSPLPGATWANPNFAGVVFGQTFPNGNVSLDGTCKALFLGGSGNNVAFGSAALGCLQSGSRNIAIGLDTLGVLPVGEDNVVVGACALRQNTCGCWNVAVGSHALCDLTQGFDNVAIGYNAGYDQIQGSDNVFIGRSTTVLDQCGSRQLAIGWGGGNWLTGCCSGAIKPGAGIIDTCDVTGTAGQVLTSTGTNAVEWASMAGWESLKFTRNYASAPLGHGIFQVEDAATQHWAGWVMVVARRKIPTVFGQVDALTMKQWMNVFGPNQFLPSTSAIREVDYPVNADGDWEVGYYPDGRAYWKFTAPYSGDWDFEILYYRFMGSKVTVVPA